MSDNAASQGQVKYNPTPYADEEYEVIGQVSDQDAFLPMSIAHIPTAAKTVDHMFQDYGGIPKEQTRERWHLPEHLAFQHKKKLDQKVVQATLISFTEEELEALKAEERQAAFDEGHKQGFEESQKKILDVGDELHKVMKDLAQQLLEKIEDIEKEAVALAIKISKKIIDEAVEINPEYISAVVQEAISNSGNATIRKIRVSPADLEFVEYVGLHEKLGGAEAGWEFVADESVHSGCVLETVAGEVDYDLENAWERIRKHVVKLLR